MSERSIAELVKSSKTMKVPGIDNITFSCTLSPSATDEQLFELENRCGIKLPEQLVELLRCTNGGSLFGIELVGTSEAYSGIPERDWITINNWGNGDFDWIVAGDDPDYEQGSIVFYDHESGSHAAIANSLQEWLSLSLNEIQSEGVLSHPYDYMHSSNDSKTGLYRGVSDKIKA